jgi:Zn-dependent protease with chaperone function
VTCPECGAALAGGDGWPTWCRDCDWNVDPQPPKPVSSWVGRWWQRTVDQGVRREHAELIAAADTMPPDGALRVAAFVLAVVIQLGTVIYLVVAVGIWLTPLPVLVKIVVGVLAALIVLAVAPLRMPRRKRQRAGGWVRADAPNLFSLLDMVAAGIGSKPPDRVVVSDEFNASIVQRHKETVLIVGLPLWEALDDSARVSLIGHELGHAVNGDIRNKGLIHASSITATKWLTLLWPAPDPSYEVVRQQKQRFLRASEADSATALADLILQVLLVPLYIVAVGFSQAYEVCVTRSGQRAEYRADRMALRAGGTAGTTELIDVLLCADTLMFGLAAAVRRGDSDALTGLPAALRAIPADERERLRRRGRRRLQRVDATHPPTVLRADYIAAAPDVAAPALDPGVVMLATEELRRATAAIERRISTRLR